MNDSSPFRHFGPLEDAPAFQIQRTARLLRVALSETLEKLQEGLSVEQYFLLYKIGYFGEAIQSRLSDPDLGDLANITRLLDRLEKKGLVSRLADPNDRRAYRIVLTENGRDLLKKLEAIVAAERKRLFSSFTADQMTAFTAVLQKLQELAIPL